MNAGLVFLFYLSALGGCIIALHRLLNIWSVGRSIALAGAVMLLFALTLLSDWFKLIYVGAFFLGTYWLVWRVLEEPTEAGA